MTDQKTQAFNMISDESIVAIVFSLDDAKPYLKEGCVCRPVDVEVKEIQQDFMEEKTIVWLSMGSDTWGVSFEALLVEPVLLCCDGIPTHIDDTNIELYNFLVEFAKKETGLE